MAATRTGQKDTDIGTFSFISIKRGEKINKWWPFRVASRFCRVLPRPESETLGNELERFGEFMEPIFGSSFWFTGPSFFADGDGRPKLGCNWVILGFYRESRLRTALPYRSVSVGWFIYPRACTFKRRNKKNFYAAFGQKENVYLFAGPALLLAIRRFLPKAPGSVPVGLSGFLPSCTRFYRLDTEVFSGCTGFYSVWTVSYRIPSGFCWGAFPFCGFSHIDGALTERNLVNKRCWNRKKRRRTTRRRRRSGRRRRR